METERDRLRHLFNVLVAKIVDLDPKIQLTGKEIQEMLAEEIYESKESVAALKIQKVYKGFKTRRAYKFTRAVIRLQRFHRLRAVEQR